ncbi:MAG: hypothetical protein OIF50_07110 [Flavobacteriaceae bacterium]|nr:hypothetical protein [Flavobacteriaceae bacterium]
MIKNFDNIKENMIERACELWGIEDPILIDPVIELLMDVFSYEFYKIDQEIKISDAKILERLAKILVNERWSLPSPAHALLRAIPTNDDMVIHRKSRFYSQKVSHGEEARELFFTPLNTHHLLQANIQCEIRPTEMCFYDLKKIPQIKFHNKKDKREADYTVWIGIHIDQKMLEQLEKISVALIMHNSKLESYLPLVKVYDELGNLLPVSHTPFDALQESETYFEPIIHYYKNNLYDIQLSDHRGMQKPTDKFGESFYIDTNIDLEVPLYWLRFEMPVAFVQEELHKLHITLNTFPIVNRSMRYKQHNLVRNGKIVSLPTTNEFFLNMESLIDNKGKSYINTLKKDINHLKGSYALYFGELEQFDERNAKSKLEEIIQTVREEGSSFSAIGYDLINAFLENLNEKLNDLERKVNLSYHSVTEGNNRQYLLTIPLEDTETLECNYWITDAMLANNLQINSLLRQFHSSGFHNQTVRLQTETFGGAFRNSAKEKISGLRYGLIARERIVSKEDVIEFVRLFIGKTVDTVSVSPGVGIGLDLKKGLIRTTDVSIQLLPNSPLSEENKIKMSNFIKMELEHKSVHNLPYQVTIH